MSMGVPNVLTIHNHSYPAIIICDYLLRLFSLFFIFKYFGAKKIFNYFPRLNLKAFAWCFVIVLIWWGSEYLYFKFLETPIGWRAILHFPRYPNLTFKIIDLSFGLAIVALSEELIFRFYLMEWLKNCGVGYGIVIVFSSLIFGAVHWGTGLDNTILTFLWGLLPAWYYVKSKNLWPCVLGHFATNFLIFVQE